MHTHELSTTHTYTEIDYSVIKGGCGLERGKGDGRRPNVLWATDTKQDTLSAV